MSVLTAPKGDETIAKIRYGSEEWIKALRTALNSSPAYEQAAKNWEGDFYFVVEPEVSPGKPTLWVADPGKPDAPVLLEASQAKPIYLYLDLWHGKCREAYIVNDPKEKNPAFVMSGPYSKWKQVTQAQLNPIQALMTGQMKLKGNMAMVMKHVKAAQEIIRACTRIDTEFDI